MPHPNIQRGSGYRKQFHHLLLQEQALNCPVFQAEPGNMSHHYMNNFLPEHRLYNDSWHTSRMYLLFSDRVNFRIVCSQLFRAHSNCAGSAHGNIRMNCWYCPSTLVGNHSTGRQSRDLRYGSLAVRPKPRGTFLIRCPDGRSCNLQQETAA